MSMLKDKSAKPKLKRKVLSPKRETISFSWKYITANQKYTFGYFSKFRDEVEARKELSKLLFSLSNMTWLDIAGKSKTDWCGSELLANRVLKFKPTNYEFSQDEKFVSFRFGSQRYRLLGVIENNTLCIIGYDFDHSAYNHGS